MLLVGLGNPGEKYEGTRHNIGFDIINRIIYDYNFPTPLKKFHGLYSEGSIRGKKLRVLMPQTYMNVSGTSIQQALSFFKIPLSQLVVVHDELDLALGRLKIKTGGGHGGHNGLRSTDEHVGNGYKRVRFGIGHPGNKDMVSSYVLAKFTNPEKPIVEDLVKSFSDNIISILDNKDDLFMSRFADAAAKIIGPIE